MAAGILGNGVRIGAGMSAISAWTGAQTDSVLNQARPADCSMLKLARVEPFILRLRRDPRGNLTDTSYLMCWVQTDVGNSACFPSSRTSFVQITIHLPG